MSRCRLHVFLPDDREQSGEEKRDKLEAAFEKKFESSPDAAVQDTSNELVSEVFEDEPDQLERVDSFEATCRDIFPDADILRTRQDRDVMDGNAAKYGYETAIMLQVTNALV